MARVWQRALVTGASSGIGESFARQLAARRTHLVVAARRTDRLERLAAELRASTGIDVEVLTADLADAAALASVEARLASPRAPVDLLVNNAGFGTRGPFAELDIDRASDEIAVNVLAVVRLTRAALPGMVARRHGGVINVSSISSFLPAPRWATYSSSKAFVTTFSEAIAEELRGTGVIVSALCPGMTPTEFGDHVGIDLARRGPATMSADAVAQAGLRGLDRGQVVVVPGLLNDLTVRTSRLVPRGLLRRGIGLTTRYVLTDRGG